MKSENESQTLERIHRMAEKEFLDKGFQGASLRNIVKEAGVTTGAFYGYYESKEQLFDALVSEQAQYLMNVYIQAQDDFTKMTGVVQEACLNEYSGECMSDMLEYAYQNLTATKLLLGASAGTKYEYFIHRMVEREVESTKDFMKVLKKNGHPKLEINDQMQHILASGMISAFFELMIHDIPYEEAVKCVEQLKRFYTAGWESLFEVNLQ